MYIFGRRIEHPVLDITPTFLTSGVLNKLKQADYLAQKTLATLGKWNKWCQVEDGNNCIPRTKYVRGILWFSRRYAAASAFHRLRDNLKKPCRIASIFDMYIDIGERIAGKQDGPGSIIYGPPRAPRIAKNTRLYIVAHI